MTKKQRKIDPVSLRMLRTLQGMTTEGFCKYCGKPLTGFNDLTSIQENHISGLCQFCQDTVFDGAVTIQYVGTRQIEGEWVTEEEQ